MATSNRMPNFVRGVSAAGVDVLRAVATRFADWQLAKPIDTALTDASALAREYLTKLQYPSHIFDPLPPDAQDRVAQAVGVVPRAAWVSPPVPPGTPSYRRPSWEKDVFDVLFLTREAPPPSARVSPARPVSHASAWPELRGLMTWRRMNNHAAVTKALAKALGGDWRPDEPAGDSELPRVTSKKLGLALVAIPGGTLQMGLAPDEHKQLAKRVKGRGPEAAMHVRELAKLARPVHAVKVAPFLCAETPLLARHAKKLRVEGDADNPHGVLRLDSETAARAVAASKLRLIGEAEWEWVARAAGAQAWLSGDADPEAWAAQTLATRLSALEHPLGVVALGWGEWIDDGWHPSYKDAPARSLAWEPKSRPELVRGGALALWPWQIGGELVLCHAAARDRGGDSSQAVRLALDLPER